MPQVQRPGGLAVLSLDSRKRPRRVAVAASIRLWVGALFMTRGCGSSWAGGLICCVVSGCWISNRQLVVRDRFGLRRSPLTGGLCWMFSVLMRRMVLGLAAAATSHLAVLES